MTPRDSKEGYSMPNKWIRYAEGDLEMARRALSGEEALYIQACFHAQQAAEKAIKAVFVVRSIEFRFVHDLAGLLDALSECGLEIPPDVFEAHFLTPYAVESRYPGLEEEVGSDETREALATAERVLGWAKRVIAEAENEEK